MLINVSSQELGHILAALHLLEAHACDGYDEEHNFTDVLEGFDRLSADEVLALGERINIEQADESLEPVEEQWASRVDFQRHTGKKLLTAQAEFFAGAMCQRIALGLENSIPPRWMISIMRGDRIA